MATPEVYKKNVEITPLQERLLDYFEKDGIYLANRIKTLECILDSIIINNSNNTLTVTDRGRIFVLKEIITIIKGIEQGY